MGFTASTIAIEMEDAPVTIGPTLELRPLYWEEGEPAGTNYSRMGDMLSRDGDLFRRFDHGHGLLRLLPDHSQIAINKAVDLAALIADRINLLVCLNGKLKGSKIPSADLNAMLRSDRFLDCFRTVDQLSATPTYLSDFSLAQPGYNPGQPGDRVFYLGERVRSSDSLDRITAFLDAMDFETPADRTNAVAAALTVALRRHWHGGKPIAVVTATKSHAGKDTVIDFAAGLTEKRSVSYQTPDWALQREMVGALKQDTGIGVIVIENARVAAKDGLIASAFVERFATDKSPTLHAVGTGADVKIDNDIVVAISTNYGLVSEDILNRSLPIRLNPTGDIASRRPSIGNPRHEYLPAHRREIDSELHGMIERWRENGRPLDEEARHPFSDWAKTIGGILQVNDFTDFLANYDSRRVSDDPIRSGIGLLYNSRIRTKGRLAQ